MGTKLLKAKEVLAVTTLSMSEMYRRMEVGNFPRPKRLGQHRVAWLSEDIEAWIDGLPEDQPNGQTE